MAGGIYWTLLNHMSSKYGDEGVEKYTSYFGKIFEYYIQRLFERMLPKSPFLSNILFFEQEYGAGKKTSDLMLFYPDKAVFIEVKSSRLDTINTVIKGDIRSFENDLDEIVIKAAKQLNNVINDFKLGMIKIPGVDPKTIKKYYPLLITLAPFPQNFIVWEKINEILKANKYFNYNDNNIGRFQILDCEEMEIIEPIATRDASFIKIIEDKILDDTSINIQMKNFIYYSKYKKDIRDNEYIKSIFDEFGKEVAKYLFNK